MDKKPESGSTYQQEIYRYVEETREGLLEQERSEISNQLEQEYGIDFYPIEQDFEKGNEYMRANFGLSGLLAEKYSRSRDTFF